MGRWKYLYEDEDAEHAFCICVSCSITEDEKGEVIKDSLSIFRFSSDPTPESKERKKRN